jgi:RNA recognition motif-containing protein
MAKKLYVGGLAYKTTEDTLSGLFEQVGNIESIKIITDRATGQSKGFGFVEMSNDTEATEAISKFHGYNLDGRTITVNEAQEREPRAPRGNDMNRGPRTNRW